MSRLLRFDRLGLAGSLFSLRLLALLPLGMPFVFPASALLLLFGTISPLGTVGTVFAVPFRPMLFALLGLLFKLLFKLLLQLLFMFFDPLFDLLTDLLLDLLTGLANDLASGLHSVMCHIGKLGFGVFSGRIILIVIYIGFRFRAVIHLFHPRTDVTGFLHNLRRVVPGLLFDVLHAHH